MSGDVVPSQRNLRMSDADREGVVARLNAAVAAGRLSLVEFEERVEGVLQARTFGDVEPFVADLPALPAAEEVVQLRSHAGEIKRKGRWPVPRRLVVHSKAGMVKLDMRHAVINHSVIQIELATQAGSTTIVLPPGATANIDGVSTTAGTAKTTVPSVPEPGTGPHVVVTGSSAAGSLLVRYERRFWRWRW